jgi:uncharacterized protein YjdB
VTTVTLTEMSVAPSSVSTPQGEFVQFSASVRDERDRLYDPAVMWFSDNESIVTIDEAGTAQAVSPGTAKVRAFFGDMIGEARVTVVKRTPRPSDEPGEDDEKDDDEDRGKGKGWQGK